MRIAALCLAGLLATSASALAEPQVKEKFLAPETVAAEVQPLRAELEQCYLAEAADAKSTGKLDITLVIARDGFVMTATTSTPGLSAKATKKIDACIQPLVKAVMFPIRRNDTTAIVPFLFLRTDAPGAGPQESCWDPKGCHGTAAPSAPIAAKPHVAKSAARRAPRR